MPGKPAARLTDMTAHGGMITGPGVPTVLIGKMPAATLGDMHMCPMVTPAVPPIPHVGGPILLGSTGVFIGKKPAARMGDMAMCVGPPSSIILGCMTVMIGEVGSGSQAGPAPSAAAATSASMTGVKSVKAIPPPEWKETKTENHFIDVLVHDKKNLPLAGLCYKLKDPNGVEIKAATTASGKIHHEGYAKAGSYEVQILSLANAKWSASKSELGKPVTLSVDADGIDDGAPLVFHITAEINDKLKVWVAAIPTEVKSKKAKAEWTLTESDVATLMQGHLGEVTGFTFLAVCDHAAAASGKLEVEAHIVYHMKNVKGEPLADTEVEIVTKTGNIEKKKTDKDGKIDLGKRRVGRHQVGQGAETYAAPLATKTIAKAKRPEPKDPGDKFPTIDLARNAGLKACYHATFKSASKPEDRLEYGGWVIKRPGGGYTYTPLIEGKNRGTERCVEPGPKPVGALGIFHSHPRNNEGLSAPAVLTRDEKEWAGDLGFAARNQVPISVISPNGKGEEGVAKVLHTNPDGSKKWDISKKVIGQLLTPPSSTKAGT
jgi:uncharacterized Zn-binding protein involved in type VI secretion